MKTKITMERLTEQTKSKSKPAIGPIMLVIIFCVLCLVFVPFPISLVPIVLVLFFIFMIYLKWKSMMKESFKPTGYYLRLQKLSEKKTQTYYDNGRTDEIALLLCFEDTEPMEVEQQIYDKAQVEHMYYVAYYEGRNRPYRCFDADLFEPDENIQVR